MGYLLDTFTSTDYTNSDTATDDFTNILLDVAAQSGMSCSLSSKPKPNDSPKREDYNADI